MTLIMCKRLNSNRGELMQIFEWGALFLVKHRIVKVQHPSILTRTKSPDLNRKFILRVRFEDMEVIYV